MEGPPPIWGLIAYLGTHSVFMYEVEQGLVRDA